MRYTDYIRGTLHDIGNKSANEDIFRIMDAINENTEAMACLANLVGKWQKKCAECDGLRKKLKERK